MASINAQDDSFNSYLSTPIASNRRRADDGEIDIFGAEKYFSGAMDGELERAAAAAEKIRAKKAAEEKAPSAKSKSGTKSTTSSEASFNSRSNLLRDRDRDRRRRDKTPPPPDKPRGRKFLGVFRCSCSGRNAVEVEAECEKARIAEAKEQIVRELRVERLGLGLGLGLGPREEPALSFPRNLNPVAGKATVESEFKNGEEEEEDDARSESSSELFELESISTSTGRFTESAPTTTAYEPSEASIEWSVVTASAANLSVASQSECHAGKGGEAAAAGRKGGIAHRPRLLMGCASHGAVNVDATATTGRMPEKAASFEAGSATSPTMRYQMESLKKMEMGLARQHGGAAAHVAISRLQARPALYMR